MSCLIREPLATSGADRNRGALIVVDAKFLAGVLAEVELGKVTVKMLGIDVLVNANKAALQDAEKAFQRIRVNVIADKLEFGVVNGLMARNRRVAIGDRRIGHQAAFVMHVLTDHGHGSAMVKEGGPNVAAALNEAHDNRVVRLAPEASGTARLAGPREFGFVRLNDLPRAAKRPQITARSHREADAVAKMPRGFHAAAKDALKLARRDAFLAGAHEVDGLKPESEGEFAFLENSPHADRERLPAGVALAQASAGRLSGQAADLGLIVVLAMRADRTTGPKLALDVLKRRVLVVKPIFGKD